MTTVSVARLEWTCWLIAALSFAGGVLAEAGHSALTPWTSFAVSALVGWLVVQIRRQSALEVGLCWSHRRLEHKLEQLTTELEVARRAASR